jgi:hypothetical protein
MPQRQSSRVIVAQKKQSVRIKWCGGHVRKGKCGLVEHDMTRNNDPIGAKIKTSIAFMIRGVTEENTKRGARREFVGSGGR